MRVLAIHRYFWPDTAPYAVILRAIASHWASEGHSVEVLASQPSYKSGLHLGRAPTRETLDEVLVRRLDMKNDATGRLRKIWNMMRFSLLAFLRVLFGPRRAVVMCSTVPQVLLAWTVSLAAKLRGAAFIYHCMDLHPEIGALSGEFAHPLVYKVLMRMDTASCRRARYIVVLSADMRDALLRRDPRLAESVVIINNFDLPQYEEAAPAQRSKERSDEPLVIAFTGNVGRFQNLETVVEAILGDDERLNDLHLVIMGEGAAKERLFAQVEAAPLACQHRVEFRAHGSSAKARALMRAADLGLVCLMPGVTSYAYPSKAVTYLSEGLPILAGVESESALAQDIVRWGVGGVLPVDSPSSVRSALLDWIGRRAELEGLRAQAKETWHREFSLAKKVVAWDELLTRSGSGSALARMDP